MSDQLEHVRKDAYQAVRNVPFFSAMWNRYCLCIAGESNHGRGGGIRLLVIFVSAMIIAWPLNIVISTTLGCPFKVAIGLDTDKQTGFSDIQAAAIDNANKELQEARNDKKYQNLPQLSFEIDQTDADDGDVFRLKSFIRWKKNPPNSKDTASEVTREFNVINVRRVGPRHAGIFHVNREISLEPLLAIYVELATHPPHEDLEPADKEVAEEYTNLIRSKAYAVTNLGKQNYFRWFERWSGIIQFVALLALCAATLYCLCYVHVYTSLELRFLGNFDRCHIRGGTHPAEDAEWPTPWAESNQAIDENYGKLTDPNGVSNRVKVLEATLEGLKRGPYTLAFPSVVFLHHAILTYGQNKALGDVQEMLTNLSDRYIRTRRQQLSMVEFLLWLIPVLGFIGTVIGISDTLPIAAQTQSPSTEIAEIGRSKTTSSLGVAFYTTLICLLLSALGMGIYFWARNCALMAIERATVMVDRILSCHEHAQTNESVQWAPQSFVAVPPRPRWSNKILLWLVVIVFVSVYIYLVLHK